MLHTYYQYYAHIIILGKLSGRAPDIIAIIAQIKTMLIWLGTGVSYFVNLFYPRLSETPIYPNVKLYVVITGSKQMVDWKEKMVTKYYFIKYVE